MPAVRALQGESSQSPKYAEGLDKWALAWDCPLPFAYKSMGEVTHFTNGHDPEHRSAGPKQ